MTKVDYLLCEIRSDVCNKDNKAKTKASELVFDTIAAMVELYRIAQREGLLALELAVLDQYEEARLTIPQEYVENPMIRRGVELFTEGTDMDSAMRILINKYWANNPQGEEALSCYIILCGLEEMMRGTLSPYEVEKLLSSCLSDENEKRFKAYSDKKWRNYE